MELFWGMICYDKSYINQYQTKDLKHVPKQKVNTSALQLVKNDGNHYRSETALYKTRSGIPLAHRYSLACTSITPPLTI